MGDLNQTKRIIYIVAGILVLGLAGFNLYRFLTRPTPAPPEVGTKQVTGLPVPQERPAEDGKSPGELKPGETLSISEQQALARITDFPVVSPSLNKKGDRVVFYKKEGGDLFASDFQGKKLEKISDITIVGILEALWSKSRDRAAVFYLDQETLKAFLHIGTSSVATLPKDIRSFSWSPDGSKGAYLLQKDNLINLVTITNSGKNQRTIFTTPILDAQISWVSNDIIAFHTAPSGLAEGFIFTFSRSSGSFKKIIGPLFGLTALWSGDGSKLLSASTNVMGGALRLEVRDASGNILFVPDIATLPQKCVFADTKTVYCALPRGIPEDTILPDDYFRGEFNSSDRIVRIDLIKRGIEEVLNRGSFDISDLIITKDQQYLFFVDRIDGSLWSLKLK